MNLSRRGFFGMAAASAVAGPSMAKNAVSGLSGLSVAAPVIQLADAAGGWTEGAKVKASRALTKAALKTMGVPEWMRAEWRAEAKERARLLDPDLEQARYMSLSVKMIIQQQRNEAKQEERFFEENPWRVRRTWLEAQGFDFLDDE